MRILQGKWRGRVIPFPEGAPTRPLTEKAREALFHILAHRARLEGAGVIDLFAGSGSVGLEFLSRGARWVRFVERDEVAVRQLRRLLAAWGAEKEAQVIRADVLRYLEGPVEPADYIFAGPPFRDWRKRAVLERIFERGWLTPQGVFILEHPVYERYDDHPAFWRQEKYVASLLSFFLAEKSPWAGRSDRQRADSYPP